MQIGILNGDVVYRTSGWSGPPKNAAAQPPTVGSFSVSQNGLGTPIEFALSESHEAADYDFGEEPSD